VNKDRVSKKNAAPSFVAAGRRIIQIGLGFFRANRLEAVAVRKRRSAAQPEAFLLKEIWNQLIDDYFPEQQELKHYKLVWSSRNQRRTLASCNIIRSKVVVASELNYPEYSEYWEPLLYHELCHAAIGLEVERYGRKRAWHGREFRTLERRHPKIPLLDAWIKQGGFTKAVRSARTKAYWTKRRRES
jgi:hypothetical protein